MISRKEIERADTSPQQGPCPWLPMEGKRSGLTSGTIDSLGLLPRMNRGNRKIGLGVMGFAEMLIRLGISYDSDRAIRTADWAERDHHLPLRQQDRSSA
jgi:hypothetical protein